MGECASIVIGMPKQNRVALWDYAIDKNTDFELVWFISGTDEEKVQDAMFYTYGFCYGDGVTTHISALCRDHTACLLGAPIRISSSFNTIDLCKGSRDFKDNPKRLYGFFDQLRTKVQELFPGVLVHDPVVVPYVNLDEDAEQDAKRKEAED